MSETQIPNLPPSFQQAKGVVMSPPPAKYLEQTTSVIRDALATLEPGERGGLVWVATKKDDKVSVNLAVVGRVNNDFQVLGWIGKEFGEPVAAGVAGRWTW